MTLLDTDHLSVLLDRDHSARPALESRLSQLSPPDIQTTVISAEEQARGWLAKINQINDVEKQVEPYDNLAMLFQALGNWELVPFDNQAAQEFKRLRKARVRIGSMDLNIAAIALVHDALLLSANLRDFQQVPGLRVEDWLH
jgi:tRNA(fMet)-specific endonuclease VapC